MKNRLKRIQYRPDPLTSFLTHTGMVSVTRSAGPGTNGPLAG
ncbi:hypothetical protein [Dactylosporangium darangshiense]